MYFFYNIQHCMPVVCAVVISTATYRLQCRGCTRILRKRLTQFNEHIFENINLTSNRKINSRTRSHFSQVVNANLKTYDIFFTHICDVT